jgi:hypothetical protein
MSKSIADRFDAYLHTLNAIAPEGYSYTVDHGRKYNKVVMHTGSGHRSVHSFVDPATGALFKAEGWARPAKGIRFDLSDDASWARLCAALIQPQQWAGGYLYR